MCIRDRPNSVELNAKLASQGVSKGMLITFRFFFTVVIGGAIVYDPLYNAHDTGSHIESRSRLDAIMERIRGDEHARRIGELNRSNLLLKTFGLTTMLNT